jgi:uncharacterized protein with ParB-like and HNH nuclease domain
MNIKNEKLDVEGAFKNYFYIIPDYQREYVWKENNVSRFLDPRDYKQFFENKIKGNLPFKAKLHVDLEKKSREELKEGR